MLVKEIHAVVHRETLFPSKGFVTGFYWPMGIPHPPESRSRETNRLVGWINFSNPPTSIQDFLLVVTRTSATFPLSMISNDKGIALAEICLLWKWKIFVRSIFFTFVIDEFLIIEILFGFLCEKKGFWTFEKENSKLLKLELEFGKERDVEIWKILGRKV